MPRTKTVQLSFLAYQARLDLELYYDLDLPKLSKQNITRLRELLRQSREEGLTPEEVRLVQLVFEHSNFSHGTQYLQEIQHTENKLQSLQMRVRAQQQTYNRHTNAGSRTDSYVFFAYGKRIPDFLQQDIDKITFRPSYLQNENTFLYQRAFVTWSPNAGPQRRTSPPVLLGDCRFYHQHTSDTDKHYIYQQQGQVPFVWSVTDQQEIFYGKDILWGLAYQIILHLRYIGGSYQQHVLNNLDNNSVQVLQEIFMPVASYPELKLPLQFNIADEGVSIVQAIPVDTTKPLSFTQQKILLLHQDRAQGKILLFEREDELYKDPDSAVTEYDKKLVLLQAVRFANIDLINKILSENNFDINEDYFENSLLNHAIKSILDPAERMAVVKLLIAKGANPNQSHGGENAYYCSVKIKDKELFCYLLTVSCPHPQDPNIKTLPSLNKDKTLAFEHTILDLICIHNLVDWLPLAIANGANIHQDAGSLYIKAAQNGHLQMVEALIAHGARLDGLIDTKTPLIEFVEQGNVDGVKLLLAHNVDVYAEYNGKNALDYAKENGNQHIIELFNPYPIRVRDNIEYRRKKYAAVTVVTAQDPNTGKRVVLVGQRRNDDNTLDNEYRFPGGLVDPGDKDFIDAAKRELKEETGINLTAIKLIGKFTQHTVAKYSQVYDDEHYDIRFIHFHLHIDPAMLRVKADDDLGHVKWLPVENISMARDQNGRKRGVFIEGNSYTLFNQSNVIVLESICYGGLDKPAFERAMLVENFGYKKLMEYTRADNVAGIEDLIADGVPLDSDLLSLAAKSGSKNAVKFYLENSPELTNVCPHPAVAAALGDHWEIFDLLYDEQMDQYSEGMILNHCIRSENLLKLLYCLNHFKIDINLRLKGKQNFITTAAMVGNIKIVQTLVLYGAALNPEFIGIDHNGVKIKAPLHAAIAHKHVKLAIYLITKGADVNCPDNITQEAMLRGNYQSMMDILTAMQNGFEDSTLDITDEDHFQERQYNINAVTKAILTPGCEEVVQYVIDNNLVDVNLLDINALEEYKDRFPKLFAMLATQTEAKDQSFLYLSDLPKPEPWLSYKHKM